MFPLSLLLLLLLLLSLSRSLSFSLPLSLVLSNYERADEIIENMHLKAKDAAARSNQKKGWEVQVLIKNMRESALAM